MIEQQRKSKIEYQTEKCVDAILSLQLFIENIKDTPGNQLDLFEEKTDMATPENLLEYLRHALRAFIEIQEYIEKMDQVSSILELSAEERSHLNHIIWMNLHSFKNLSGELETFASKVINS